MSNPDLSKQQQYFDQISEGAITLDEAELHQNFMVLVEAVKQSPHMLILS